MALCWAVPIAVIMIYSSYTISNNVQGRIRDTIITSVNSAFQQTEDKLSSVMDESRASSYDETIGNAYARYQMDEDSVTLYDTVTTYLLQQYGYDSSIDSTFLFFTSDPDTIYYASNRTNAGQIYGLQHYKANIHERILNSYPDLSTRIGFLQGEPGLYMVRNIVDRNFSPYAVIVMECNETELFKSIRSIVWLQKAVISIDDMPYTVVGEGTLQTGDANGVWYDAVNGDYTLRLSVPLSSHTLALCVISDSAGLVDKFPDVRNILPLIGLAAIGLLLFAVWAYYHYISRPVNVLVDAAGHMEAGERGYVVDNIPTSHEFRYLTESFNSMSTQLKYQFDRSYQEQLALQDARVKALRSQINPHFLNNTLEVIGWEARMVKDVKVCRMIEALSMMLTAATVRGGSARGNMEQELAYTDAYLYILFVRLGERLTINKQIAPETLKVLVPCLILQPIVENAIEHGIALREKGELTLRSMLCGDALLLEVENDGRMTKADRQAISRLLSWDGNNEKADESRECIGIRNVNRRLKILYGEEGGLTITEIAPGRVLARIVIPHVEFYKD
ncbi:MAG: sensor histidine kinase [Acetanaerobacterium sp.]